MDGVIVQVILLLPTALSFVGSSPTWNKSFGFSLCLFQVHIYKVATLDIFLERDFFFVKRSLFISFLKKNNNIYLFVHLTCNIIESTMQ